MEWKRSTEFVAYEDALTAMEARVASIRAGTVPEQIWLLEHPALYTAGTSAKAGDLLSAEFPVYDTGRGGQYTYHGPGQRVAYVMLDLKQRQSSPDIKRYVCNLEQWIIDTLQEFDIKGERRQGRVGIWVVKPDGSESKIAAIGVRVRHWVTYHGVSINLAPDLSHFNGIVPCGISDAGVTSFEDLGVKATMAELDEALQKNFSKIFG
ncbi:MAG: lipoyl(octanoyl) transferase LipB [Alphaproteobacteria bacterium]|nr:lipoyl(octanoyl) transferase LipB [Alphaproteobacteria bacterium]